MIIADKIVSLRKRAGWSQEELAEKLGVTRQSVSKWEGAQSVPDMDKVVSMSRLFGVTTDYLLKDELEEDAPCAAAEDNDPPLRRVTMEQASAYLALRKAAAPKVAAATALCIVSPVTLLLLSALNAFSTHIRPDNIFARKTVQHHMLGKDQISVFYSYFSKSHCHSPF